MSIATTVVPKQVQPPPRAFGAGMTHRGRVRSQNEDAILTDPDGRLWAVADGMGGYGHGEVASDIVIDCLETIRDDEDPGRALTDRLAEANARVRLTARERNFGQMGATAVAAIFVHAMAHVAWVGDARAYLLRAGRLRMLTRDHSLVQSLVDRGEITAAEAETHPEAHIVTRAVGGDEAIEIDRVALPVIHGDRLMLCSDGLPRALYESTIEAVMATAPDPDAAVGWLMREALDAGAPDNVSIIVVDIRDEAA